MFQIIYFGMTGNFSAPPLEKLITADVEVKAVIVSAAFSGNQMLPRRLEPPSPVSSDLAVLNPPSKRHILHLAWQNDIPAWEVGPLSAKQTLDLLAGLKPDLIVVACFTDRFPPAVLDLPRHGCLNLHPSPLPAYRGPAPLFWMARQGETRAGVTLHFLDKGLDTGDIVAQTAWPWPDGISRAALEQECAGKGADLLLEAVQQLAQGEALPRQAQQQAGDSYFPWPEEEDCVISTTWPARRAFNFMQIAQGWPLAIEVEGRQFSVQAANGYDPAERLDQPYMFHDDELWIQFQPGVLKIRL